MNSPTNSSMTPELIVVTESVVTEKKNIVEIMQKSRQEALSDPKFLKEVDRITRACHQIADI